MTRSAIVALVWDRSTSRATWRSHPRGGAPNGVPDNQSYSCVAEEMVPQSPPAAPKQSHLPSPYTSVVDWAGRLG